MGKRILTWCLRAMFVGVLGVIFVLSAYGAFSLFVRSGVTAVPALEGLKIEDARALLSDQGLDVSHDDADDRYDPATPAGQVVEQRPRSASLVKRGSAVHLVLSRGPNRVTVPDVVGESAQTAQVTLAASGLSASETFAVWSEDREAGQVVMQEPGPDTTAAPGASVRLFVAKESRRATFLMPDLVYRSYDDVRSFFSREGFRFGSVKFEPYEGLAEGTVLRQFPLAGHPLRRADPIALVVAAPAEPGV